VTLYYITLGLFIVFLVAAFMPPGEGGVASHTQWIMSSLECALVVLFEVLLLFWLIKKIFNFLNRRTLKESVFITMLFITLFILYMIWQNRSGSYFGARNLFTFLIAIVKG